MDLEKPIEKYVHDFETNGRYGKADKALNELFKIYPQNRDFNHVLIKVVSLNTLYNTGILAVVPAAEHICEQSNVDIRLKEGDLKLVDDISKIKVKSDVEIHFFSFATKYCSWHQPDKYPIYDSFVGRLLREYQRVDNFPDFRKIEDLKVNYARYKEIIEAFMKRHHLEAIGFKKLDIFLWMYGKELFDTPTKKQN